VVELIESPSPRWRMSIGWSTGRFLFLQAMMEEPSLALLREGEPIWVTTTVGADERRVGAEVLDVDDDGVAVRLEQRLERRRHRRSAVTAQVSLDLVDAPDPTVVAAVSENVSVGGLKVRTAVPLHAGQRALALVDPPAPDAPGPPITAVVQVIDDALAQGAGSYLARLRIERISDTDRARLAALVAARR
jgi:hypothetical protein